MLTPKRAIDRLEEATSKKDKGALQVLRKESMEAYQNYQKWLPSLEVIVHRIDETLREE